jgi:hypothetical protein
MHSINFSLFILFMDHLLFRRFSAFLASLGVFTSGALVPVYAQDAGVEAPATSRIIPGAYIVTFKENAVPDPAALVNEYRLTGDRKVFLNAVKGFASSLTDKQIQALKNDPRVAAIEPDVEVYAFGSPLADAIKSQRSARDIIDEIRRSRLQKPAPAPAPVPAPVVLPTGINRIDAEKSLTAAIDGKPGGCGRRGHRYRRAEIASGSERVQAGKLRTGILAG